MALKMKGALVYFKNLYAAYDANRSTFRTFEVQSMKTLKSFSEGSVKTLVNMVKERAKVKLLKYS